MPKDFQETNPGVVPNFGSERPPTVALKGDGLTGEALQAVSPHEIAWSHKSAADLHNALVMMVDDEELNVEMTAAFLEDAGYARFVSTTDSRQALDLMRQNMPAALLLDLSMPHVDGIQILASLRVDKQLRRIPVIVLTATTDSELKLRALSLGAVDFLAKPVDPGELALRLRNTLAAAAYRDYVELHDPLTALPSKMQYRKDAAELVRDGLERQRPGALVHIGVDGLGAINEGLGRATGDHIVQRFAKQLASLVATEAGGELSTGERDPALYRFDGDEFAVLVPNLEPEDAGIFLGKLLEDSTCTLRRGGHELYVTCSVGVSLFPQDGHDADELMSKAGLALRKAKEAGRHRYEFYSQDGAEGARSRLSLASELRRAFGRDEVELLFQGRYELASNQLTGVEATLAWQPEGRAGLSGEDLLASARETDLARDLMDWTLEKAAHAVVKWQKSGIDVPPMALTFSVARSSPSEMYDSVVRWPASLGLKMLVLNLQDLPAQGIGGAWEEVFGELRRQGVRLSLAKVGGLEGVLAPLASMLFAEARLDSSLAARVDQDPRMVDYVRGLVRLSHAVRAHCVASGVNSVRAWNALKSAGVDQYLGPITGDLLGTQEFAEHKLLLRKAG